jgi:hypothetical protein
VSKIGFVDVCNGRGVDEGYLHDFMRLHFRR